MSADGSPPGGDIDRGASLIAMFTVEVVIASLFVAVRFWARLSIHGVGTDDWWMLVTNVCSLILTTYLYCTEQCQSYFLSAER